MFELLIIHHSHTDVGYTAPQSTVGAWQTAFIRQALDHAETEGELPFRWVCESFWSVERFWNQFPIVSTFHERMIPENALIATVNGLAR